MTYSGNPTEYTTKDHKQRSKQKEQILSNLTLDWLDDDAAGYLDKDILNNLADYDSGEIYEELRDQNYFDVEIIYYSKAMEYLKENDFSLSESLEIAAEFGYNTENLNSELLASLHASRKKENDFFEHIAPELDQI
tara:strand:- start:763 stop:1170 length:408 start_codon:yes stop_codon:yes gene_type:complete